MKLATKILARVIVLPLLLAAGLVVAALLTLRVMFTPADLEAVVTNQFQEFLRRPVQIDSARLSLTGEIQVRGLRVTEPGPETVEFLKADYIYATYRVLPLLQRKLEIDSVVLVAPQIELYKRADGTWNVSDILAAYRHSAGRNMLNKIDSAEVKDGRVNVTYVATKRRHSLENFTASLSNFKPGADTPFHASVFLKSDAFRRPVTGRLYTEGTVNFADFRWEEAEVKDLRADLTVQEKTVSFAGRAKNFLRPEVTLRAETPLLKSSDLAFFFAPPFNFTAPRASWDLSAVFLSSRTAELRVVARPLNLRTEGTFDFSKSTPSYSLTVSAPPIKLDLLKRYGAALPVENPSGTVQLRMKISSKNGQPVLSRFFINTSGAGLKYRNLTISGADLAALLSENFASNFANATRGKVTLDANTMANVRLKTEITRSQMLYTYSGNFNGSFAKGRILVRKPFSSERILELTGYSAAVVYSELKDLVFGIKDLRGPRVGMPEVEASLAWLKTLKNSIPMGFSGFKLLYKTDKYRHEYMDAADFYAQASLRDIAGDISKIRGDISFRAGAGTFYDVQRTSEKDRVFYLFSLPLTFIHRMNRTGALKFGYKVKDISFTSIGGDYYADGGKVEIKNFWLEGKEFSAAVTGQLDFYNETMDVKIYTISGKYYSMGSLPEALTDSSGKPALAFTLKGKMADPKFEMVSPAGSGDRIREAAGKGAQIDFAGIDAFAGGKK
ncbi:MAG: hypothetical protein A2X32_03060 [Elusimicrobia bacterium GWC2_64_44]|nr:MAG: hypothetical protein A2X32_03060 [Elusimicrobia bacterium GWC2_64_44]